MRVPFTGPGVMPPVHAGEVVDCRTPALTLEPGHPMRGLRCLVCAAMVGGREVRVVSAIAFAGKGCLCGAVPSVSFLFCAEHGEVPNLDLVTLALERWTAHHGEPS